MCEAVRARQYNMSPHTCARAHTHTHTRVTGVIYILFAIHHPLPPLLKASLRAAEVRGNRMASALLMSSRPI